MSWLKIKTESNDEHETIAETAGGGRFKYKEDAFEELYQHYRVYIDESIIQSPGTRHPAPGTRHPAPGTRHPAPGTRHPAPGTQRWIPRSKSQVPSSLGCPPLSHLDFRERSLNYSSVHFSTWKFLQRMERSCFMAPPGANESFFLIV